MKRFLISLLLILLCISMLVSCSPTAGLFSRFDTEKISNNLKDGNTEFAFNIFRQVNSEDRDINVFISPLSISTALTMTYQGAAGTTKEAMAEALELSGIDMEELNESYKNLLGYLKQSDKKVQLDIGNSIWIREGFPVREDFMEVNKNIFDASVSSLDFSEDKAADTMNKWIKDATKGKIEKMIDPPIPSNIIMYLINAIYFKGQWSDEFDRKDTFSTQFNGYDGKPDDIMMMKRLDEVDYMSGEGFKAVRLPYGKGNIAMYCVLPDKGTDINDFIEDMTYDKWNEIKDAVSETEDVMLQIPRFNMEYGIKNLNDALTNLGMGEAFSDNANFSGIGDNLAISRVLHKAVIEVNEEGSTAAGVTVVEMRETAALMDPPSFIADRPFMFAIADDVTDAILFMGKLSSVVSK